MPTAPASFAPRPSSHYISPEPSHGTPRRGWLVAAIAAFAVSAVAIAVLVVHFFDAAPVSVGAPKIVVASAAEPGMSTRTQPNVGPALGNVTGDTAHSAAAAGNVASAQPNVASAVPSATASAPIAATASAPVTPSASIPAQQGAIIAGKEARQHRVFVDGKPVGEGPGTYFVSCGTHSVKIGSSGKPRDIDLACGTSINVP